jgi:hypothetical protein
MSINSVLFYSALKIEVVCSPKCWYLPTSSHSFTTQKPNTDIFPAVRNLNVKNIKDSGTGRHMLGYAFAGLILPLIVGVKFCNEIHAKYIHLLNYDANDLLP